MKWLALTALLLAAPAFADPLVIYSHDKEPTHRWVVKCGPGTHLVKSSEECLPNPTGASVPEPASLALFALGLGGLALSRRRRD